MGTMRKLLWILLMGLYSTSCWSQTTLNISTLDSNLTLLANTNRFNGTVLYAEKGKIIYEKAFGTSDFRTGAQLTTASSFNLASVSKQFITACIMVLYDEGKLNFDDAVTKYIPEWPYNGITIRNLMTHTSGIPDYWDVYMYHRTPLDTLTNAGMISLYIKYKPELLFTTGTNWEYSNTNYVLLSTIIERVSGQNIADFFKTKIAMPAGLKNTYVYQILMPVVPENHVYGFSTVNGENKLNDLFHIDGVTGDGNIYSSVEDLYKWEQLLYTGKIIKKTTFAEALKPVQLSSGKAYPYGFGWFIEKENSLYWHTGSWVGFYNIICRDIENNRTLIVLSSGDNDSGRNMAKSLFFGSDYTVPETTLINNVMVIDGTGTPAKKAAVRIAGDQIIAVGDLTPFQGEKIIDGKGKILVPGFIDTHSHVDRGLNENPDALAAISQGITTIVVGQDGESDAVDSIKLWSKTIPKSVNIATYTGHATIREQVMGAENLKRPATQNEIDAINKILADELAKGSLGLSTGLEYEGGFYSSRDEVIQLAKTTAAGGGKYISHLRSEDINLQSALEEIITIGYVAQVPVQISHIKIALKDDWGTADDIIAMLEAARMQGVDITADCYPYTYWNATIRVLFPNKDFTSMEAATYATTHLFDPSGSVMVRFAPNPEYKGKTISQIATMRNETPEATLLYLVAAAAAYEKMHPEDDDVEAIMGKSMSDEDIIPFLSWAHTNICSDGANGGHPRGYGAFTRVLSNYIRVEKIMSLETGINKMTALSAEHVGISNRGVIAPGYFADLVLFDAETVRDNANIDNSKAVSDGILMVWVNGVLVYADKTATAQFPGVFISK